MKRLLMVGGAFAAVIIAIPMFSAFEAHVVNVTATIDNALSVNTQPIVLGEVFPQEILHTPLAVGLSTTFNSESNTQATNVTYFIRQKPKCGVVSHQGNGTAADPTTYSSYVQVGENAAGDTFVCPQGSVPLPSLCPFLSKTSKQGEGEGQETDGSIPSFHGTLPWTVADANNTTVHGSLTKGTDTTDNWDIDLHTPCFVGQCAQDWATFVHTANAEANPLSYQLPVADEHQQLGCDLWVEVDGIPQTGQTAGGQPPVGANLALYTAPSGGSCNVTADPAANEDPTHSHTINGALAKATAGQTVCVVPGTYNESVNLNVTGVTLASTGGAGVTTINGGVDVNANNTTVKGFTVTPGAIGVGPTQASFFVEDVADNANITDNDINGAGHPNAGGTRGVILAEGGSFTNVLVQNNKIHNFTSDIYVSTITSTAGDALTIKWNDITVDNPADNGAGGAAGVGQLNDAIVTLNEFTSEVAGGEAIGAGPDYEASNVINFNNFLSGSKINDYSAPATIQAPNNFFNVSAATQAPVNVTTTGATAVQYAHR